MYAPPEPWPPAVREFIETSRRKRAEHIAYRPHAGHEAADRGLRADRLAGRTRRPDRRPLPRVSATAAATSRHVFSRDQILTNLTIYWVTATIGPVMNGDCDFDHFAAPTPSGSGVQVPSGFAVFADSTARAVHPPPRQLAGHSFNVTHGTEMPRGGHFAVLEEPELFGGEIREFFRPLRGATTRGQSDRPLHAQDGSLLPNFGHAQRRTALPASDPLGQVWSVCGAQRSQPVAADGKSDGLANCSNTRNRCRGLRPVAGRSAW
jgi:hypothetical protein